MHRSLCDFLADLFQNAVEASASHIGVELVRSDEAFSLRLTDDGRGMDEFELRQAQDPFYSEPGKHPHRRVGLGLPFVIQQVKQTGGIFDMRSSKGAGTEVSATFPLGHWDTPPIGDLPGTLAQLIALPGDFECRIQWKGSVVTRKELREALGSFDDPQALMLLAEFFRTGVEETSENGGRT